MNTSGHDHHCHHHHGHAAPATETTAPPGTIHTCPMHPEIRQEGPGICPKCGMALEPEMPSLDDGENPELVDFRRRFWWTLPLTAAVFVLAMSKMAEQRKQLLIDRETDVLGRLILFRQELKKESEKGDERD